jgi:hypothetical protein
MLVINLELLLAALLPSPPFLLCSSLMVKKNFNWLMDIIHRNSRCLFPNAVDWNAGLDAIAPACALFAAFVLSFAGRMRNCFI